MNSKLTTVQKDMKIAQEVMRINDMFVIQSVKDGRCRRK